MPCPCCGLSICDHKPYWLLFPPEKDIPEFMTPRLVPSGGREPGAPMPDINTAERAAHRLPRRASAGAGVSAGPAPAPPPGRASVQGRVAPAGNSRKSAPGATTAATAAEVPAQGSAQPQFAESDPDSPYTIQIPCPPGSMIDLLDEYMMTQFVTQHWPSGIAIIPGAPQTASEAAELQWQADQLLAEGRACEASPWLCQLAQYSFWVLGDDHADTVQAMWAVFRSMVQLAVRHSGCLLWLLPQAAKHWGLGDTRLRQLVNIGAQFLYQCADPRLLADLALAVAKTARHLPGGLGWGTVSMGPVDEATYCKHVILQSKAEAIVKQVDSAQVDFQYRFSPDTQRQLQLARSMLQRCIAYYESLGPHWLGTPRKVFCKDLLASTQFCIEAFPRPRREWPEIATVLESIRLDSKRTAQRELGPEHPSTIDAIWSYGETLQMMERYEQCVSFYLKAIRLSKDDPCTSQKTLLAYQVGTGEVFRRLDRLQEAEDMLSNAYNTALRTMGPKHVVTRTAFMHYWVLLTNNQAQQPDGSGTQDEAAQLLQRAAQAGCDVSGVRGLKRACDRDAEEMLHITDAVVNVAL